MTVKHYNVADKVTANIVYQKHYCSNVSMVVIWFINDRIASLLCQRQNGGIVVCQRLNNGVVVLADT